LKTKGQGVFFVFVDPLLHWNKRILTNTVELSTARGATICAAIR
jgi:hypothetical protein